MITIPTKIKGAYFIKPVYHDDDRGSFYTSFNRDLYSEAGMFNINTFQMCHSISKKNVLRGLHYQAGLSAQSKLVWVTRGSVQDVFVDLRTDSPTYGQWDHTILTEDGLRLFIPKGCAHGFLSLQDDTHFNYMMSNPWDKDAERVLLWNDADININWHYDLEDPIVSSKDQQGLSFKDCEKFQSY